MKKKQDEVTIDLRELWRILTARILPIVISAMICIGAMFAYSHFLMEPVYKSTATLYILNQDNTSEQGYEQSDYTLALNVINDCTYMITSEAVLNNVIDELNLNMSYGHLKNMISTSNPANTRIIEISVKSANAVESKRIVDCVCNVAAKKIGATLGMDSVNVYSTADLQRTPCNAFGMKTYALGGIIAAFAVYLGYVVAFLIDDKIKTAEDVEQYLGLVVLGDIPNIDSSKQKKGKYYRYQYGDKKAKGGKSL